MKRILKPICFSALTLLARPLCAQEHAPFQSPTQAHQLASELHDYGIFSLAAVQADKFLHAVPKLIPENNHLQKEKARYIRSVANLKLERPNALEQAINLATTTSDAALRQRLAFALGKYYFYHNQLPLAINWYEKAGLENLTNREIAESKFELAYAYLLERNFKKAEELFGTMRNADTRYSSDAKYYYGLLSYNNGNYELALQSFETIQNEPRYATIVPYYIAELHYFLGKKEEALKEAKAIILQPSAYFNTEAHLLAGQVLYEQKQFEEALQYLEYYFDHSDKMHKAQLYEMGYAYYSLNRYNEAIEKFKLLSNTGDTLGQSAMYLLGNAYLKTGDKAGARNAFALAAEKDFNPDVQEASLFTTAKLAYELGLYNEASGSLRQLATLFPQSNFITEAKSIQSDLLARTNNYADAYALLKETNSGDEFFKSIKQRVAYGLGIVELQNKNIIPAQALLQEAVQINANEEYTALANHWLGEIAYEQKKYNEAIAYQQAFLRQPASNTVIDDAAGLQHNALLTLGYAAMQMEDYSAAQQYFNRAKNITGNEGATANALIREADAAFMKKDFNTALTLYDSIARTASVDADYARLQTAILHGLKGNKKQQIVLLQQIINKNPVSPQLNDARFELANVYLIENEFAPAIELLQPLIDERTTFASRALFKKAFALQQINKDKEAIANYKKILTDYPYSEERDQSIDALKALFIENNQPDELAQVLRQNNLQENEESILDSAYYSAAINQYAQGNFAQAQTAFQEYLNKYPNGNFRLKANYYAGNSAYQQRKFEAALPFLEEVLKAGNNEYTEPAAQQAATITFAQKNYESSNTYYTQLAQVTTKPQLKFEALVGQMRIAMQQQKWLQALPFAEQVLPHELANEVQKIEAQFVQAKVALNNKNWEEATRLLSITENSKNQDISAESIYRKGEILLEQQQLKAAEAHAGASLKKLNGHDYWLVKNYILLADILTLQKDWFNARATLQSVIKNSKDELLKKEAEQKLERVNQLEKEQSKLAE